MEGTEQMELKTVPISPFIIMEKYQVLGEVDMVGYLT
jgi:hypothetical protein